MLPFAARGFYRGIGYMQSAPMIRVHKMYTELVNRRTKDWNEEESSSDMLLDMKGGLQRLKEMMNKTFDGHC